MTLTDHNRDTTSRAPVMGRRQRESQRGSSTHVGSAERAVSIASGAILLSQGIYRRSFVGMLTALVGGAMLYRGFTGHSHTYGRNKVVLDPAA